MKYGLLIGCQPRCILVGLVLLAAITSSGGQLGTKEEENMNLVSCEMQHIGYVYCESFQ